MDESATQPTIGDPTADTLIRRLRDTVVRQPDNIAFRSRSRQSSTGEAWTSMRWETYGQLVERLAATLLAWHVGRGDRVAVLSENRWEWHVADMAAMTIGAVTVPVYPTSSPSQIAFILGHAEISVCVLSSAEQLAKVTAVAPDLPALRRVVVFDSAAAQDPPPSIIGADGQPVSVVPWTDAVAEDIEFEPRLAAVRKLADEVRADDLATIVYTSGTTGTPKGVLLTHHNITTTIDMVEQVVPLGPDDRFLSFLPLSHIAERVVSHFGQIASGGETWFAHSYSTVASDILDCRPTVFFAVPRVWEKIRDSIQTAEHAMHGPKRALVEKYHERAHDHFDAMASHVEEGFVPRLEFGVLDRLVGQQIREKLGLDQARALFSGAAPIDPRLLEWLRGIGLDVGEVYGQTEVCGPTTITPLGHSRIGTVGKLLPGLNARVAADSEVLVRGPSVTSGYFRNAEATTALFDDDGWMRTGDLGTLDDDGYLRITGRKKDLMKTAQGKYIAPQDLELRLRSARFIGNAVVVADGRPFVSALLTLNPESVGPWAEYRGKPLSIEALSVDPDLLAEVRADINAINEEVSPPEQIRSWWILPRDLTLTDGELTPTLKVVRSAVMAHFAEDIDRMYRRSGAGQA